MKDISIKELVKKYNCFSETTLYNLVNRNIFVNKKNLGRKIILDEEEVVNFFKIPKDFSKYTTLTNISKKYNVSPKSIHDYFSQIKTIKISNIWYIYEEDFLKILPKIQAFKQNRYGKEKNKYFDKKIKEILGDEYLILDNYVSEKKPIRVLHKPCQTVYLVEPTNILHRKNGPTRCPNCFGTRAYSLNEVEKLIKETSYGEYVLDKKLTETYKNNKSIIYIRHTNPKCKGKNKPFKIRLNDFLNGEVSCIFCNMSVGEERILSILENNSVENKHQEFFTYEQNYGYFDFYLPKEKIIIEFDGIQHFDEKSFFDFVSTTKRDHLKNEYISKNKDLVLVRISFKKLKELEKIIELVLNKEFKRLRDYPLGEYEKVLGKSVVLSDNIYYIG